jgi:hypothetical protein
MEYDPFSPEFQADPFPVYQWMLAGFVNGIQQPMEERTPCQRFVLT